MTDAELELDRLRNALSERDERIAGYRAIIDAAGEIGIADELGPLLEIIMARGKDLLRCEACSLMLLDAEANELVFKVAQSQVGSELTDAFRIPVGQGVAGHVAETRRPFFTNNAYASELFSPEADHATGFRTRAILCVPLFSDDKLVGVAQVLNPTDGRDFSDVDVDLFCDLAAISGVAVENARLRCARDELGRLEGEMELAREIQNGFLRHSFPDIPGYTIRAGTRPATWVGGDLYDVEVQSKSGKISLIVGDVSGKGASSSLHGARTLSEIRLLLEFSPDPAEVMTRLNNLTYDRSSRGMFVTLVLMLLDPEAGQLTVLSAGHPPPLIYDVEKESFVEVTLPKAPPLGVIPDVAFSTAVINLPERCLVTAFSDGIIEARNGSGHSYDLQQLKDSIRKVASSNGAAFLHIRNDLMQFVGKAKQHDDSTLLCVRRGA